VLTALARLDDDNFSQLRLISAEALNLFLMEIANRHIADLNIHSKVRLFNMLRQQSSNTEHQLQNLKLLSDENLK